MRISLDYKDVHSQGKFKVRHYWDGWRLVFLRYNPTAYISPRAMFRNGSWYHVLDVVEPNDRGLWLVKESYVNN